MKDNKENLNNQLSNEALESVAGGEGWSREQQDFLWHWAMQAFYSNNAFINFDAIKNHTNRSCNNDTTLSEFYQILVEGYTPQEFAGYLQKNPSRTGGDELLISELL